MDNMADEFVRNIENGFYEKMILKSEGTSNIDKDAIKNFDLWIEQALK